MEPGRFEAALDRRTDVPQLISGTAQSQNPAGTNLHLSREKPGVSPCKPNAGVTETREPRKHTLGDGTDLVQPRASLQSDKDHLFTERAKSLLVQQPVGLAYL